MDLRQAKIPRALKPSHASDLHPSSSPPAARRGQLQLQFGPPIAFGRRKEEVPFPLQAKVKDIKRFQDQFPLASVKTTLQSVRFECDSSAIWQHANNQTAQSKKRLAVKTQPINPTSSHQLDSNFCKSKYKTNEELTFQKPFKPKNISPASLNILCWWPSKAGSSYFSPSSGVSLPVCAALFFYTFFFNYINLF